MAEGVANKQQVEILISCQNLKDTDQLIKIAKLASRNSEPKWQKKKHM